MLERVADKRRIPISGGGDGMVELLVEVIDVAGAMPSTPTRVTGFTTGDPSPWMRRGERHGVTIITVKSYIGPRNGSVRPHSLK